MYIKKFKSTRQVPRYDEYNRLLGEFTIRMIVNGVYFTGDTVTPDGFYYYINNEGETITIAPIKNTVFAREMVNQAELQLPAFNNNHLFDIVIERTGQFSMLKWQQENGSSFGLMTNEWVEDTDVPEEPIQEEPITEEPEV